ncbi:MAG: hypothetical protein EAX86_09780 [Candidatus Heimdallarchaeota archaeon]|nr:hypothetical protein [Candidatus Heimdallarchaeota archaeon]
MLRNYHLPIKLKTIQFPNHSIEIWINDRKLNSFEDVSPIIQPFILDFIINLQELGWRVLMTQ